MDFETATGVAGAGVTTIDANWGWAKGGFHPSRSFAVDGYGPGIGALLHCNLPTPKRRT
jgi:hypothetical protein